MYIKFSRPKWLVGVAVLPARAEIHPHLAGWRVLMSSPDCVFLFIEVGQKKHQPIALSVFADDTQHYLPLKTHSPQSLQHLLDCFQDIKDWMSHNFLVLNELKTVVVLFD